MNIISLGAGVQSSTMALMAAHGEITPMPDAAIFADTQAEPKQVYEWLDWLEKQLPFPVYRVSSGNLKRESLLVHTSKKSNNKYLQAIIPSFISSTNGKGMAQRHCTRNFKIDPVSKKLRLLRNGSSVVLWIGISTDEGYRVKSHLKKWITNRWPLIEKGMSRNSCLQWMKSHGYPKPPRSACIFCPYHSNAEWRNLSPSEFQEAVVYEKQLQDAYKATLNNLYGIPFLHSSRIPLDQVDFSTDEDRGQLNMFNNECEGLCGV